MSAIASLVRAYESLATRGEVPAFGYSQEKIGFLISLNTEGTPAGMPIDKTDSGRQEETALGYKRTATGQANVRNRAQLLMGQDRLCARHHGWGR